MNEILDIQLIEVLNRNGITTLTELEQLCIPKIKSGRDMLCIAAKGSGRTFSVVVSVLQKLKKAVHDNPRAVVIVPDVARALEIKAEFDRLGSYTNLRVHTACENEKLTDQKDRIYMGSDVVIGTSKRMNEIYSIYALNLSTVKLFVIDDAEEVIRNMNFSQMVRLSQGPNKTQFLLYASRITEWIERFAEESMNIQEVIEFEEDEEPDEKEQQEESETDTESID